MTQPVLLTLASAAEHPLIDIDSTAFIQFAIFVVMALASTQLLFKPYLRMREARDAGMDGARKEAANLSAEADAKLAEYEDKLAGARARAQEERRKIRAEAAQHLEEITGRSDVATCTSRARNARDTGLRTATGGRAGSAWTGGWRWSVLMRSSARRCAWSMPVPQSPSTSWIGAERTWAA